MSKKDRIALVISALYIIVPVEFSLGTSPLLAPITLIPLLIYWGYRFIKNNISFLNIKEK